MPTRITNRQTSGTTTLAFYGHMVGAGRAIVVAEEVDDVVGLLGGSDAITAAGLLLDSLGSTEPATPMPRILRTLTLSRTIAQLQALGAVATATLDLGQALPAGATILAYTLSSVTGLVAPAIQPTSPLSIYPEPLVGLFAFYSSGTLETTGAVIQLTQPGAIYLPSGGQIKVDLTVGDGLGPNFADLTAGGFTLRAIVL